MTPQRGLVALLKFLGEPATCRMAGDRCEIERDGRTRNVDARTVRTLASRGAVRRDGDRIQRTPSGTALLKRLLAGRDAYAEQHRERASVRVEESDGTVGTASMNVASATVERLARQRDGTEPFLHPELVEAARRLRSDFERGMLRQRVTIDWDAIGGGGKGGAGRWDGRAELSDAASGARTRFEAARTALGSHLRAAVEDACCMDLGLEEIERRNGWPKRSGKMMLRAGLEQLALHYRAPRGGC